MPHMQTDSRIYVAGHRGLVGSAIMRQLEQAGHTHLITRSRSELDLRDDAAVDGMFAKTQPEYVFFAAGKVGGILANSSFPVDFLQDNLQMAVTTLRAAHTHRVEKLLFLGSSCIYPKLAPQPIQEESLLGGFLEPTNEPYALAKIAGIRLCQAYNTQYNTNFISAMPTNLYGPNDNFDLKSSHVLPALLRKFHEAKISRAPTVQVWGTGSPRREFLHVDDLADACVFLMRKYNDGAHINVGAGSDISIAELAHLMAEIVGFEGSLTFDTSKPDGTPQKLLDVTRLSAAGWTSSIELRDGIQRTYDWFLQEQSIVA